MSSLRLLIVDDEPLIRAGIRMSLEGAPDIEIAGECGSGSEAIRTLRSQNVDVVLLDVRMPDSSGLDVVREVGPERMPLVIFVTAYDEYAVRAFELNAVDYLLKPFDEERLLVSIGRARERLAARGQGAVARQLQALLEANERKAPERLAVRNDKDGFEFVLVNSIDWIESADNYVVLHCGARTHVMSDTLSGLEQKLDRSRFLRVHRCRIVNISRIATISPMLNGAYELELRGGLRLSTGRQFKGAIQALLGR